MPRFDLAGNPLPDKPSNEDAPRTGAAPARAATPRAGVPAPESAQSVIPNAPPAASPPPIPESADVSPFMADTDGGAARFDLAGNPLPLPPGGVQPPASGEAGVWPPAPTGGDPSQMNVPNDSGEKASYPPEVAAFKWNWSPWFWSWVWCFGMKMPAWGAAYLGLIVLSFVPFVNFVTGPLSLALTIYLCVSGHRLAWQNRRFAGGFPEYLAVQRAWFKWGIGVFIVGLLLVPILAAILFPVFARARMNARMRSGYYSQPNGSGGSFAPPPAGGQ